MLIEGIHLSDEIFNLLSDLQNDSEKIVNTGRDQNAELPFWVHSHFKKFEIKQKQRIKFNSNRFQQGFGRRNADFQTLH